MTKITILRGVPGCGKSTWARSQAGNPAIVSRDELRVAIWGSCDQDYYKVDKAFLSAKEAVITNTQNAAVEAALRNGRDVIIDNTNIDWKFVREFAKIAAKFDAEVIVKVFDVPLATALKQNQQRERIVPEEVIRKMHSSLQSNKHMVLEPEVGPVRYNGTPGKPKAFMVDIDGTLAHMRNYRGPFEWHNVHLDVPDPVIVDLVNILASSNFALDLEHLKVIVMSGRDESCRELTTDWLNDYITFDELFMRPEKDMRKDNIVKAELFDAHVRDNYDVQFVLDDRNQVVDMWREMGIKCLQVQEGDF